MPADRGPLEGTRVGCLDQRPGPLAEELDRDRLAEELCGPQLTGDPRSSHARLRPRGDAPADGARVERGSGAGRGAPAARPHRTECDPRYRFAAESFSQSLAAIVSSGPNRAARASWTSAALPTTTIATASGGGMSFAAVSATCSGVTAATRSR